MLQNARLELGTSEDERLEKITKVFRLKLKKRQAAGEKITVAVKKRNPAAASKKRNVESGSSPKKGQAKQCREDA